MTSRGHRRRPATTRGVLQRIVGALACAGAALLTACSPGDANRVDRGELVTRWLGQTPPTTTASDLPPVQLVMDDAQYAVGIDPPDENHEFGRVTYGALLKDNVAVVVDAAKRRLVLLGLNGRVLHVTGRKGGGPGEIEEVSDMLPWTDTSVALLDNRLARLTQFAVNGSNLVLEQMDQVSGFARPVCRGSAGFVGLEYNAAAQAVLHLRSRIDDDRRRSFGLPFLAGSHRLNDAVTQGQLLCLTDAGGVVLAGMTGALVRYDADGRLEWRREVEGFLPVKVEERDGGLLFTYAPPPLKLQTTPVALVQLTPRLGILQLGRLRRQPDGDRVALVSDGIDTRFFDLGNGAEIWRQDDIPRVLSIRAGSMLVAGDDPEPWVALHRFRLVGGH